MGSSQVVAVNRVKRVFALETDDKQCAVFCTVSGPEVRTGDIIEGDAIGLGVRALHHRRGALQAVGAGPTTLAEALRIVNGTPV